MSEESPDASAPEFEGGEHDDIAPATPKIEADPEDPDPDLDAALDEAGESVPAPVAREPWERTGHASVDRALASLEVLDETSVHEHVAVFEEAHRTLRRALDESDAEETDKQQSGNHGTGVPPSGLG